jgi:vitamin B12 transporter
VELKSIPVFNTSLLAGYAYVDAIDRETGEDITAVGRYTLDAGIQYDDKKSFQGTLKGHYIRWHVSPFDNGRYSAIIWDLNLAKKIYNGERNSAVLFFTAHNIFNGAQYPVSPFKNPGRWFEGGVRVTF